MKTTSHVLRLAAVLAAFLPLSTHAQIDPGATAKSAAVHDASIDVVKHYYMSGWMGDGALGTKYLQIQSACTENPHTAPNCIKVTYTPSAPDKWAAVYWQNKPNNWGDKPGDDLSMRGFKVLSFWARGATGNEQVEFKIGGIDSGKAHKDSCETSLGTVTLTKHWKQYQIPLSGCNVTSMIGMFCFALSASANQPGTVTFYLDDITYE